MTAKEELSQYKYLKDKVQETLDEYQRYKVRAEKMTSIISDMPRGGKSVDKVADNAVAMADLSRQYEELWLRAENEKLSIEQNLSKITEPYRTILHMLYVQDMSLVEAAFKLNANYTYMCEMHGKALQEYENKREPNFSEDNRIIK